MIIEVCRKKYLFRCLKQAFRTIIIFLTLDKEFKAGPCDVVFLLAVGQKHT